jgi:asparagine synthase (glutamine-hydrolysing)
MCGINGIASTQGPVDRSILEAMRDVLRHRGPDGEGLYLKGNIGLGHRRLSIVDLALGHQPMTNEDGSVVIVYNGEIYNHADWRPGLEKCGHVYRSHCDTETIVHLYEEYGVTVVDKLRGMFAFAIWDVKQQMLFLARDRLGVKPLYYYHAPDGSLVFASEIKALFAAKSVKAGINFAAMPDFLANHAPSGEMTLFEGVRKLLPGHTLTWQSGRIEIQRYWSISFPNVDIAPARSDSDYVADWSALFRESVRLRLMADVPLGMFLSGGIDSSAIAATMSTMVSQPIKTFSVAFAEREANELEYARLVAQRFGTDHHEIVVSPAAFFDRLPDLVWHEDEPLAHPSSVALNFVSTLAAQHVKVVLTGEGSDEMLGGYDRYRKTIYNVALGRYYHALTNDKVRRSVVATLGLILRPTRMSGKLRRTFLQLDPTLDEIYFDNFAVFSQGSLPSLLSADVKARVGALRPYVEMNRLLDEVPSASMLNKLLYVDTHTYLQELLMKQDQMSMAASIESRVPFLDHKLCEFTARMPDRLKLRGLTTKWILRESMKDLLPPEILKRSKMGFPVPLAQWFRGPFRWVLDEYVLGARATRRGIFNNAFVAELVKRHQSGAEDNAQRLWALVNFEIWCRRFIEP